MGRAKKIYEWLKNVLWIINRQKDKDYIKINEKINIIKKNISTGEIDFYPQPIGLVLKLKYIFL